MGREGIVAMTDKIEIPRIPKDPRPRRPSYDNVAANIEKWANSTGLQSPWKRGGPGEAHAWTHRRYRPAGRAMNE